MPSKLIFDKRGTFLKVFDLAVYLFFIKHGELNQYIKNRFFDGPLQIHIVVKGFCQHA
jgi:hypothetical protein